MHLRMPTLAYPQQLRPYRVCASACPQTGQGHHNPFLGKGLTTAFSAGPLLIPVDVSTWALAAVASANGAPHLIRARLAEPPWLRPALLYLPKEVKTLGVGSTLSLPYAPSAHSGRRVHPSRGLRDY